MKELKNAILRMLNDLGLHGDKGFKWGALGDQLQ